MDLAAVDSVREGAAGVQEKVPCIDALICNAAVTQVAKQEITVDRVESQLGVNHFALPEVDAVVWGERRRTSVPVRVVFI